METPYEVLFKAANSKLKVFGGGYAVSSLVVDNEYPFRFHAELTNTQGLIRLRYMQNIPSDPQEPPTCNFEMHSVTYNLKEIKRDVPVAMLVRMLKAQTTTQVFAIEEAEVKNKNSYGRLTH